MLIKGSIDNKISQLSIGEHVLGQKFETFIKIAYNSKALLKLNPLNKYEISRATSRKSPHAEDLILGFAQNVRINQRVQL